MAGSIFDNPTLTFALAMTAGVVAQGLARHAAVPGIVVLLAAGVLLGPDVADVVRPAAMGSGLDAVVGFAVAVVLFEGGLNLRLHLLRQQARPIRRLVTLGAVVTALGGTLAAKLLMGWDWRISILFGTLVIVTGPTVITPLLRRIRVKSDVSTILEAEGIFIDAVGATIAIVALEVAIAPSRGAVGIGFLSVLERIGVGTLIGAAAGASLAGVLRAKRLVPRGLQNILALSTAVLAFELSNAVAHESGIAAAIVAGMVVGNIRTHGLTQIVEFKEQLTVLLIATLFVLLAADVRLADVEALGWRGAATVVALMVLVRPVTVWASTHGTSLTVRDKLFLSWLAPRGIVAAAVASLFAMELTRAGIPGGVEMKALVFLVIATTVTVQGLSGGFVAQALRVRSPSDRGFVLLGANSLSLLFARIARDRGQPVVIIDSNIDTCRAARQRGFEAICGNGLEESTMRAAEMETRTACLALTGNESVNFTFAQKVRELHRTCPVFVALEEGSSGFSPEVVTRHDAGVLFGRQRQLRTWIDLAGHDGIELGRWQVYDGSGVPVPGQNDDVGVLPLAVVRKERVIPVDEESRLRKGDEVVVAIDPTVRDVAHQALRSARCRPVGADEEQATG